MTQIVGVVGLGTMGAGIVQVCLAAGHTVIGMDGVDAARDNLGGRVEKGLQRSVAKGTLTAEDCAAALARLSTTASVDGFADTFR